jgi:hypothetical protein
MIRNSKIGRQPRQVHAPWRGRASVATMALLLATAAGASGVDQIRFLKATDLPGLGLRAKLMSPCEAHPLPSPTAYNYLMQSGADAPRPVDLYDPAELWIRSQHAGRWTDNDGSALTLAAITYPLPRGFQRRHVTPSEYEAAARAAARGVQWNEDTLAGWVRDFTGAAQVKATKLRRPSFQVKALVRFDIAGATNRLAYATIPAYRRKTADQRANPWLYVQVELAPRHDRLRSRSAVEQQFIGTLTTALAATSATPQNRVMQNPKHAGNPADRFRHSRTAAAQSISNLRDWWLAETANYVLLSNLSTKHRTMVTSLQDNVALLRDIFAAVAPPIDTIDAVSVIRIFATQDAYVAYVGPDLEWTSGVWMPTKKELVIRPVETGSTREQRNRFLAIVYHEAFHQYLFYALGKRQAPVWFNEGHAEFFEQAEIRGRNVTIGEDPDAVELVLASIAQNNFPIERLLAMDYPQFYDRDPEQRRRNYALAWALVYYLHRGAILERPARYHKITESVLDALADGATERAATQAAFADINMSRFREHFSAFWTSSRSRADAKRSRLPAAKPR